MFSSGFTSFGVLLLFLNRSPSLSLRTVFNAISLSINEVLSINISANVFAYRDFNVNHKERLTSSWYDRPSEFGYTFSTSTDLTQMNKFLAQIPHRDYRSPVLLDLSLSFDHGIYSTVAFPPSRNSDHVSVSIECPSNLQGRFLFSSLNYFRADWDGLRDQIRDVSREDMFKLMLIFVAFATAAKFCGWVQVGLMYIIPHRKYQVKPNSSPSVFSYSCSAKLAYVNKAEESITSTVLPLSTNGVVSPALPVRYVVLSVMKRVNKVEPSGTPCSIFSHEL